MMRAALKRTAQLSLLARDLAAVRARKPGKKRDHARHRLVDRLGLLHGLPQKIGQLLAFSEIDASDPAFTKLTENEPSLSTADARAEVERQLGTSLEKIFSHFEPRGIAASIGQVHRATLRDGRHVALKIQYPGIEHAIKYDLHALGWLTAPVGDLRHGFDLKAYRAEIGDSLRRELDYRREATSLGHFGELARTLTLPIALPSVIAELSNNHLLTTTWLEGDPLATARQWPESERAVLSASLIEIFFKGIFQWGLVHADPHPGNYRFLRIDDRATVGLLDFGCVKVIPPAIQRGMRGLVSDAIAGVASEENIRAQFTQMGFNPTVLAAVTKKLPAIGAALTLPFTAPGKFHATRWDLGERLRDALGDDRMAFRTAGPPEMIFILRAFQGLVNYLKIFDAPVNWRTAAYVAAMVAEPLAQNSELHQRAGGRDTRDSLQNRPTKTEPPAPLSATLHVSVIEKGTTKVALAFRANATEKLPDLVPLEFHARLIDRGIDLASIARTARQTNYCPGELFSLTDGAKSVRVWLK